MCRVCRMIAAVKKGAQRARMRDSATVDSVQPEPPAALESCIPRLVANAPTREGEVARRG